MWLILAKHRRHYFENTLQFGLRNFTVERAPQIQFCGLGVAPDVYECLFQTFGEWVLLKIPANPASLFELFKIRFKRPN